VFWQLFFTSHALFFNQGRYGKLEAALLHGSRLFWKEKQVFFGPTARFFKTAKSRMLCRIGGKNLANGFTVYILMA
jgi:hypothetical protein